MVTVAVTTWPGASVTCPGETVSLSAEGTADPDGQPLGYRWFPYREITGIYSPNLRLGEEAGMTTCGGLDPMGMSCGIATACAAFFTCGSGR